MATIHPPEFHPAAPRTAQRTPANLIAGLAVLYWLFQIVWFWRFCRDNINADAVSYLGIARHAAHGELRASLHGYWSPLISWAIAAVSFTGHDPTRTAHLLML